MERFLRKRFLGQKQFSLEGLDVMIPMLDDTIELASEAGAHEVVMGMAHRGRLNVLAHTIGMPYEYILREFEGERTIEAVTADPEGGTGDVKYHLSAHGTRTTANGKVGVRLVANPSHLEAVNPVVEGRTRAEQTDRSTKNGAHDPSVALAVLLHGDAAFAGQGVVAETLQPPGSRGLLDRRHPAPDHEQPDRVHDRPARGTLDAVLVRPRQGIRRADRARQRRRPGGRDRRRAARDGVSAQVRAGHRDRPRRLPALRSQRAGRGRVHPAADGRADQRASERPRAVSGEARRGRRADARKRRTRSSPRSRRCCGPRTTA